MRVLVIEDEHKIANVVKEGLTGESFAVDVCYGGETGLNTARQGDYDLIIIDRLCVSILQPRAKPVSIGKRHTAHGIHRGSEE